jgi:hypothetical protein
MNKKTKMWIDLLIASIQANAVSLAGQLNDYDFLTVTEAQAKQLDRIEKDLHRLVQEITNGNP